MTTKQVMEGSLFLRRLAAIQNPQVRINFALRHGAAEQVLEVLLSLAGTYDVSFENPDVKAGKVRQDLCLNFFSREKPHTPPSTGTVRVAYVEVPYLLNQTALTWSEIKPRLLAPLLKQVARQPSCGNSRILTGVLRGVLEEDDRLRKRIEHKMLVDSFLGSPLHYLHLACEHHPKARQRGVDFSIVTVQVEFIRLLKEDGLTDAQIEELFVQWLHRNPDAPAHWVHMVATAPCFARDFVPERYAYLIRNRRRLILELMTGKGMHHNWGPDERRSLVKGFRELRLFGAGMDAPDFPNEDLISLLVEGETTPHQTQWLLESISGGSSVLEIVFSKRPIAESAKGLWLAAYQRLMRAGRRFDLAASLANALDVAGVLFHDEVEWTNELAELMKPITDSEVGRA